METVGQAVADGAMAGISQAVSYAITAILIILLLVGTHMYIRWRIKSRGIAFDLS
jgi:hypothetical protein